jgi:hypothetical protein
MDRHTPLWRRGVRGRREDRLAPLRRTHQAAWKTLFRRARIKVREIGVVGGGDMARALARQGRGLRTAIRAAPLLVLAALLGERAGADDPLAEVLRRAGEYVRGYEREASGVVLEESYRQTLQSGGGEQSRVLTSDLVLISLIGDAALYGFRDVFGVDGRVVRDRDARLERLFLKPSKQGVEQAGAILEESARFNLGSTLRTFNLPTVALEILHPDAQGRFTFKHKGRRTLAGKTTYVVAYQEWARPTLIRGPLHDRDCPARGAFAVIPETGAVLASEIGIEDRQGKHRIVVEYSWVDKLGLWLPAEMQENLDLQKAVLAQDMSAIQQTEGWRHATPWRPSQPTERLEGTARYSKARRFGVTTEERATPQQ